MQTLKIFYEGNRELLSLLHCHIDGDFGEERGGGGGILVSYASPRMRSKNVLFYLDNAHLSFRFIF